MKLQWLSSIALSAILISLTACDKAKDAAVAAEQKAKAAADEAAAKTKEVMAAAPGKAKELEAKAKELAGQAKAKAEELAGKAGEKAKELAGEAKDLALEAKDKAKELAGEAGAKTKELVGKAEDKAKEMVAEVKEKLAGDKAAEEYPAAAKTAFLAALEPIKQMIEGLNDTPEGTPPAPEKLEALDAAVKALPTAGMPADFKGAFEAAVAKHDEASKLFKKLSADPAGLTTEEKAAAAKLGEESQTLSAKAIEVAAKYGVDLSFLQ